MKKFSILSILVFSVLLLSNVSAQGTDFEDPDGKPKVSGFQGTFYFGLSMPDVHELNTSLTYNGFAEFPTLLPTMGGGGQLFMKNVVISGEGHNILKTHSDNANAFGTLEGGYGMGKIGYTVISRRKFLLAPMIGLGGGGWTLTLQPKDSVDSYNGVLASPGRMTRLDTKNLLSDLSLHFQYYLVGDLNNGGGLCIGITAGYIYALNDTKWKLGQVDLSNGPNTSFGGMYFRLSLSGGGLSKK